MDMRESRESREERALEVDTQLQSALLVYPQI
jgi:hypothetical protein